MEDSPKSLRNTAIRMMLNPIVKYCVRKSTTIQEFTAIAKVLFVQAAIEEMEANDIKINMNRISLTTGVHRKDVREIYKEEKRPEDLAQSVTSRILARWSDDEDFTTKSRKPRVLSYRGEDNEFRELLMRVNRHLSPKTVLIELERLGLVTKTSRGLKMLQDMDPRASDEKARLSLLARNMQTLITASDANSDPDDDVGHLHVRTEYDSIFYEDIPRIKEWLQREGKAFHRKVRTFLSKYDNDIQPNPKKTPGAKVSVGAFAFSEEALLEEEVD